MKLTWLGHSSFRLEIGGEVILLDPWLEKNPVFPRERRDEALRGATAIFLTHGHFDHAADAPAIARETGARLHGIPELMGMMGEGLETVGFNKGGTVRVGEVAVTMVNATHSSAYEGGGGARYAGSEAGFMIAGEGRTIYATGDTDVMADMEWMGELHRPEIGLLCCGGHYTMDMERAAWAARRYFRFRTVIPSHYRTFPVLAQSAEPLRAALPDVDVRIPGVMETIEL